MRYNGKAFAQRGIAQLVEQRSPKPRAEGSNPSAPAKALTERSELFCFSEGFEPPGGTGRRHAAGSRFVRRPRRSNATGSPQRSAAGRAESFCPCQGSDRKVRAFLFPSPVLPPSDEGGGKPEGLDGGRDRPGLLRSGMRRGSWLRVLSLSRLRRQLPRQREPCLRGATCPSKKPPCLLDKAALGCYIGVSKSGARARCWSLPSIDLRSKGKPLPLRWRLFLYVPEDTKDNRCHEQ